MKRALLILGLACLLAQPTQAQELRQQIETLDGILAPSERKAATDSLREGPTTLFLQNAANLLRVTVSVQAEPIGVASLCLANAQSMRVLHASAALGMIHYEREGPTWTTDEDFVWVMRDTTMTAAALDARQVHLEEHGWVATTYQMGHAGVTEFLIRGDLLPEGDLYLGLGIMPQDHPAEIIGLPSASVGDCARGDLVRGNIPVAGLRFDPLSWKAVLRH